MGIRLACRSYLPLSDAARFSLFLGQMPSLIYLFALVESHGGS